MEERIEKDSNQRPSGNGLATATLILGIESLLLSCFYGGILGILGLVLGIIALIKGENKGMSIAGIITSGFAILITVVVFIIGFSILDEWSQMVTEDTVTKVEEQNATTQEDAAKANSIEENSNDTDTELFQVGDIVETKEFRMTYESCGEYISDNEFIQPDEGNYYMRFDFEIENISDSDIFVSASDFECYADGYETDQSFALDWTSSSLATGKKAKASVLFQIPVNAKEIELQYEVNTWTSEKIKFSGKTGPAPDSEENKTEEQKAAEQPADNVDPSAFYGDWYDTFSQRCGMSIYLVNDLYYDIVIDWGDSAWDNTHWDFTGEYDASKGGIVYSDGYRYDEHYSKNGGSPERTEVYHDGSGLIYLKDGKLYWIDDKENMGANCIFEKENTTESGDYILPDSDTVRLTKADIQSLSLQELNYAKNEIYARHGRKFLSQELSNYFNSKSWYNGTIDPADFNENVLSQIEKDNMRLLADAEFAMDPNGYQLDK